MELLEGQHYYSEGAKCGACGSDLGRHEVWTLVFSDDPAEVVERVLSGEINRVRCPQCNFDGGWLWSPQTFLFVDTQRDRAVCATLATAAKQQLSLLRDALGADPIRQRGLDLERLLARTKLVTSYRDIAEASRIPIEQIELENDAIQKYLERKDLRGTERIEHLLKALINTGALSLEADEDTPEFLEEVEQYRAALTGQEDPRIPQTLEQLIEWLRARLINTRKSLPRRDGVNALSRVLNLTPTSAARPLFETLFKHDLEEAKTHTLQLRLARLCGLQSRGLLVSRVAAPIDFRRELLDLTDELIDGQGVESTILTENDLRVLPEVKRFLGSLGGKTPPEGLQEAEPDVSGPPPPSCMDLADEVLAEIGNRMTTGAIPSELLDPIAESPLAGAYVHAELGRLLTDQDQPSGAKHELETALELIQGVAESPGDLPDYWMTRLHAVCLERLGRLQLRYARLEDAIEALHSARSLYEQIGARDGVLNSLRYEASIWFDLGDLQRAEGLYATVVRESEGSATAEEVRDLANLANVYRRLGPWIETTTTVSDPQRDESVLRTGAGHIIDSNEAPFETKGGIGVSIRFKDHNEPPMRVILRSEQMRLLYRALAVATLNGDTTRENQTMGQIVAVYGEQGCDALASGILERILENTTLENASVAAQYFVFNRLQSLAESYDADGDRERARATRTEGLQLIEFILVKGEWLPPLLLDEMRGEKACLLEALDQTEDARREYRETIAILERSRLWMRDPDNKRGLQSRRWRPYVRAARNALRMYFNDRSREDLLTEAWHDIEAGRSRAMLDAIAAEQTGELNSAGIASVRPAEFVEVSARLARDLVVLEYALMPTSPGCPGSWVLFVIEPLATKPRLVWQEPDMERVLEAQRKLGGVADEYEKTLVEYGFRSGTPELEQQYAAALESLADIILPAGLLDELRARGYRRLVIVPEAYLHEVPFAALRPIQADERAYLGLPSERSGFQIIYAPTSSIFGRWTRRASERNAGTSRRSALFVDPLGDLSKSNPAVMQTFSSIEARLQDREVEVARFDRHEATPEAWLNKARERDLIVYFGHSIAGPKHAEQAALTLSDGAGEVAAITADAIYRAATRQLFSRRSLFVLASCSSGLVSAGAWDSDRELMGLSAAHLYAGCGAVIAASRPLLDSPTLVLVDLLVAEILSGGDAASSLTEVLIKLAAHSQYSHPHFWGYLGVMGAPDWRLAESMS